MKDTMKDTIKDTMKDTVKEMNKIDLEQVTGGCIPIPSIPGIPYVTAPACFLQVLFGENCKQKWRKLNLQNGEFCRCPEPGLPARDLQAFINIIRLHEG